MFSAYLFLCIIYNEAITIFAILTINLQTPDPPKKNNLKHVLSKKKTNFF